MYKKGYVELFRSFSTTVNLDCKKFEVATLRLADQKEKVEELEF